MSLRFVAKALVLLGLLSVTTGQVLAQDKTCNAGDIQWVKETVAANTNLAGAAAFNDFAAPFGIQSAFDETCAGAIIRIVKGTNNYGPLSASWTGRDATTMQINIDTVDADATPAANIFIEGWVDENTQCGSAGNIWTASCPVPMDFAADTITGADGFNLSTTGDGYRFFWIQVQNVDSDCFSTAGANTYFSYVGCQDAGDNGIIAPGGNNNINLIVHSRIINLGNANADGIEAPMSDSRLVAYNYIRCWTGSNPAGTQIGIQGVQTGALIYRNVIENCEYGISGANSDGKSYLRNTIRNTVLACIQVDTSSDFYIMLENVMEGCGTSSITFGGDTHDHVVAGNIYDQTGSQLGGSLATAANVPYDPEDALNGNGPDWTALTCAWADADSQDYVMSIACQQTVGDAVWPVGMDSDEDFAPGAQLSGPGSSSGSSPSSSGPPPPIIFQD